MTEAKKTEAKKPAAKIKVLTKRSIWVDQGVGKKAKKVKAGELVELSAAEIKHFGSAVTKDFDEDEE